jgi:subtilisin family serine protease
MKKEYKIRGKIVTVEELDGIRAIKPAFTTNENFRSIINTFDDNAKGLFKNLQQKLPNAKDQLALLSKAGWIFVEPSRNLLKSLDTRSLQPTEIKSNRVYEDQKGNILIGSNHFNLKLQPEMRPGDVQLFFRKHRLQPIREYGFSPNFFEVSSESTDIIAQINELDEAPEVLAAEPQMIMNIPHRFRPTDPQYSRQWHHNNDGRNGLRVGADIKSELAWNTVHGKGIKIAIIDNGFDVTHPDIAPALHRASGYFLQTQFGVDFKSGLTGFPIQDHGTFCAGMAIARESNGVGGCGVAHHADFIAIACLNDQVGTQATLARALAYAIDPALETPNAPSGMGADVISCSLGPNGADWKMETVLEDAINFVVQNGRNGKGTPIFWAVSNGNFPIAGGPQGTDDVSAYANTISVGRSRSDDKEDGSAFGPELDFLAPGVEVFSTTNGGHYGYNTGTSFAAPLAAGTAAVILSKNQNLTWQQVRDVMRNSCDQIGGVTYVNNRHDRYGHGRINLFEALKLV